MSFNDLAQAFQMFQSGVKEYAVAQGVNQAAEQVQALAQDATLTANQKLSQQNSLATQLQAQMAAAGAPQSQIQAAVGALTPPKVQDAQQAVYAAQSTDDPELKKQYLSLADQFAKAQAAPQLAVQAGSQEFQREERALDRQLTRETAGAAKRESTALRNDLQSQKLEQREEALTTPLGKARTVADANNLKTAYESKASFDSKLDELIKLRESKGGEAFDREAVARGRQLSKDLLLEYKNIAKLGVLSAADEDIINAIIPSDPLKFRSPLSAVTGQDPILSNLKKFKADKDVEFATRAKTRLRDGESVGFDGNTAATRETPLPLPKLFKTPDGRVLKAMTKEQAEKMTSLGAVPQ